MSKLISKAKHLLASIPSPAVTMNIMQNADVTDDGTLLFQGKKIGSYDWNTGIGSCSIIGYVRILRSLKKA